MVHTISSFILLGCVLELYFNLEIKQKLALAKSAAQPYKLSRLLSSLCADADSTLLSPRHKYTLGPLLHIDILLLWKQNLFKAIPRPKNNQRRRVCRVYCQHDCLRLNASPSLYH